MTNQRLVAYVLIGLGTITLLARLSGGAGWLWIGLVAAAMLFAYARQRTYGLLVLGGILGGTAVGILLQEVFRIEALFLVSLGAGIAAIDVVERRANRWPRTLGAVLAALGVLIGLQQAGAFASVWFALLLIAAGIAIIMRGTGPSSFPPPRVAAHGPYAGAPPHTPRPAPAPAPAPQGPDASDGAQRDPVTADAHAAPDAAASADGSVDGTRERRARLEAWRRRSAERDAKAPQSVLSDEVLDELAAQAPGDLSALASVRGIGPVKLERYGPDLIAVLHDERG
jgi:hypothetical protein